MGMTQPTLDELLSHAGWLRRLAGRLVGEPSADDAVQEVWLRAAGRPPLGLQSPRGWLRSALRSVYLRTVERRNSALERVERAALERSCSQELPSTAELAERAESQKLLVGAVLELDEPDRQAVLLHFFEGLSAAEISRRSGIPSSTIRTRVSRGVHTLRERLDRRVGGLGAWVPGVALLSPPQAAALTPTLLAVGTALMWKLGASIVGVVLLLWAGAAYLDGETSLPSEIEDPVGDAALATADSELLPASTDVGLASAVNQRVEADEVAQPGGADPVAAPDRPAGERTRLMVEGYVLNPSGEPASGATVYEGTLAQVNVAKRFPARSRRASAKADADGRFELEFDEARGVILCACAEGFADSAEFPLDLRAPLPTETVTLKLRVGGAIRGVVYGLDQQPVEGRSVSISCASLGVHATAVTAKDGKFRVAGLNPGPFRAATFPSDQELRDAGEVVSVAGAVAHLKQAEFTVVDGEAVDVPLGLVSVDAPHVHGVVRHEGRPVGGLMQWYPASRPTEKMVSLANKEGAFKVDLPSPGPWIVHVNDADAASRGQRFRFDLAAGERREVDINLTGGRISGRVMDSEGRSLEGIQVELRCVGKAAHLPNPTLGGGLYSTDEEGRYEFELLLTGSYIVIAHGSSPAPDSTRVEPTTGAACTTVIDLTGTEDLEAPSLTLSEGETVQISVNDTNGRPVSGASLYFHDADGYCLNPTTITRTAGKGITTSPALSPNPIWVTATHFSGASQSALITAGTDKLIELVIQDKHWIELDGGPEWIDETKSHVSVVDASGRRWSRLYDLNRLFEARPGRADPKGPLLGPLPTGSYRIEVRTEDGAVRHGSLDLREKSPEISTVLLR